MTDTNNTDSTNTKGRYTVTKVFLLAGGGELRSVVTTHPEAPPTMGEMSVHWLKPLAEELAGKPQRFLTDIPKWTKAEDADRQYYWSGDGGWMLSWQESAVRGTGWRLYGPDHDVGESIVLVETDLEMAMAQADQHIMNLRSDPMDEEHWREEREEREHPGVLTLFTDAGPVVLPATSILYVRFDVRNNETGERVDLKPGWPKPESAETQPTEVQG